MTEELLKDLAEFDRIEDQYLSQIFATDEEINHVEAMAVERSIEAADKCKTEAEFKALTGDDGEEIFTGYDAVAWKTVKAKHKAFKKALNDLREALRVSYNNNKEDFELEECFQKTMNLYSNKDLEDVDDIILYHE